MAFDDKRIIEDNGSRTWPHGNKYFCDTCEMWHLRLDMINQTLNC